MNNKNRSVGTGIAAYLVITILILSCGGNTSPTKSSQPSSPPPSSPPAPPIPTRITIDPSTTTLETIGGTMQLTARVMDQRNNLMTGQVLTWTSSNTAVSTVSSSGLVTAVGNGSALISARIGAASGSASITVSEPVPTRISITPSSTLLEVIGQSIQLSASVRDQRNKVMVGSTVTWLSNNETIVIVNSEGIVTAVNEGTAVVIAKLDSIIGTATINVSEPVPTRITITPSSATLGALGEQIQLTALVKDQRGNEMPEALVAWSSSNENIASVQEGIHQNKIALVTALSNGLVDISAHIGSGPTGSISITVSQVPAFVTLTSNNQLLTDFWETVQIEVELRDANDAIIEDPVVTWMSSDETVVAVDDEGLVTAIGNGIAEIIAQSGGATQEISIAVEGPSIDRSAVIAIYQTLDGPNWNSQASWMSDESIRVWEGITTNERGRVTRLDLGNNNLKGELPLELAQLEKLLVIDLSENEISGSIPSVLSALSDLKDFHLQNNPNLLDPLPDSFLNLSLASLRLDNTQVCVPALSSFQIWLSEIIDRQGIITCEINYLPWVGLTVTQGSIIFATEALPEPVELSICLPLQDFEFSGTSITVHESKWQRRTDESSPWVDIEDTVKTFQVCPYTATIAGDYRLVGDATIDGERNMYASTNFFTFE